MATYALNCNIKRYDKRGGRLLTTITQVTSINVQSSLEMLTDKAEIVVPRKWFDTNRAILANEILVIGYYAIISFGYNGDNAERFRGYITKLNKEIPVKIELQDEMWKLKQIPVNFSAPKTDLIQLLKAICPGYKIDALEGVKLGNVRFPKTTVSQVLEKLADEPWHLKAYCKIVNNEPVIVCGKYFSDDTNLPQISLDLERNCVSADLNYKSADEIQVLVCGTSIATHNEETIRGSKVTFEFGDRNGIRKNLSYTNLNQKELEIIVRKDYAELKKDKLEGGVTTFGYPVARHGMKAKISSRLFPDKAGTFYITGCDTDFGIGGIRQNLKFGDKVK